MMENTPNHITGEENCSLLSYSDGEKLIIRHKTTANKTLNYHKEGKKNKPLPHSVLILHVHSLRNHDSDTVPAPTHNVSTHTHTQQQRLLKLCSLLLIYTPL